MRSILFLLLLTASCHRHHPAPAPPPAPPDLTAGWVNLTPGMVVKLETAYFKDGATVRNVETYIGTELLSLVAQSDGTLSPAEHRTLPTRPKAQPAVARLVPDRIRHRRHHRLYFQVVVNKGSNKANAVLISAAIPSEIEKLNPATICAGPSKNCTVIPEGTSASLAMQITVNRNPMIVLWGTILGAVVGTHQPYTLIRQGKPIKILPNRPLLPNDELTW